MNYKAMKIISNTIFEQYDEGEITAETAKRLICNVRSELNQSGNDHFMASQRMIGGRCGYCLKAVTMEEQTFNLLNGKIATRTRKKIERKYLFAHTCLCSQCYHSIVSSECGFSNS